MRRILLVAAWLLSAMLPAMAQNTTGLVVTTCGTVPVPFKATNPGPFTVDVNGNLCQSGTGGGGGNVNVTQWATTNVATPQGNNADSIAAFTAGLPPIASYPFLWDGVDFDRAPGDATNGAWVNVKTSVLPTGGATSANQATEISSLASIVTNTGAPLPPQSVAVPAAGFGICDGANGATNPCTTVMTVKPVSTAPVTATDKAAVVALRPDSPGIVALGQTTKSASVPVAIASDQVGTAGTANATVVTVQGIASMTKLLVTPDSVALPANQSVNLAQFGGATASLGSATGANSIPVVIASDQGASGYETPSSATAAGMPPVVCGSAVSSCVLKGSAGNLYSVYADCTAACWLMVFDRTTAPTNGATTAGVASGNMVECISIAAGSVGSISYGKGPPAVYDTGITAVISSTACATLTLSTVGFVHGMVK
jgi:hypothetical protein